MNLPHTFGRYTLLEKLAQGGMGEVYRARYDGEGGFSKIVAVKRILPVYSEDQHFVSLLIDEAHALSRLQHQNIVQVYELGRDADTYFLSMEFVAGMDAKRFMRYMQLREQRPSESHAIYIICEVLKGLAFAHKCTDGAGKSLGIVHRDISPQNILISVNGEVKIADFGIAKGRHRCEQTVAAQVKGKYAYMSPEQARGGTVDIRTDVFACGAVFFELLSSTPCFDGSTDEEIAERVRNCSLPEDWERQFHPAIRSILRRALSADPADRYQDITSFLDDVTRYAVTSRQLINGLTFSDWLSEQFPEVMAKAVESGRPVAARPGGRGRDVRLSVRTRGYTMAGQHGLHDRWHGWSIVLSQGKRGLLGVMAFALLFATSAARGGRNFVTNSVEITPNISADSRGENILYGLVKNAQMQGGPPRRDAGVLTTYVEERPRRPTQQMGIFHQPKPGKGSLTVQARPWGSVTIPGVVSSRETPLTLSLNEGKYQINVTHGPTGKRLASAAAIRPGSRTTCLASFGDTPSIRCR